MKAVKLYIRALGVAVISVVAGLIVLAVVSWQAGLVTFAVGLLIAAVMVMMAIRAAVAGVKSGKVITDLAAAADSALGAFGDKDGSEKA
jgi:ABC-type multidrug transport system fused ATPase/permease subunit